ncbi:MAG TPA: hypothetical protein VK636_05135 [Gemmatimonadaceae bacterium]|nr:hypothetical protein [Gemmatimonadaceae bacterium]
MQRRIIFSVTALAVTLMASACGRENPTSPTATISPSAPSFSRGKPVQPTRVVPLELDKGHNTQLTASATIGVLGGTLSLPATGLVVIVPPLAVNKPTLFKVTAVVGTAVAYEFSPAGTQFTIPLVATQSLATTKAKHGGSVDPLLIFVGYFPNPTDSTTVTELNDVALNLGGQTVVFPIWHFSGYIFASGRK